MKKITQYLILTSTSLAIASSLAILFSWIHFQNAGAGGYAAALWNALLFSAWCCAHSLLARDRGKALTERITGKRYQRIAYNTFSGITLIAVLTLWQDLPGVLWRVDGIAGWALTALYLLWIAGMGYSMMLIGIREKAGFTALAPDESRYNPVTNMPTITGPYAHCRHPFYVFYLLALLTGPVMTVNRIEFAALSVAYCFIGTVFEERNLRQEYGAAYDTYRRYVPMWLPRLRPWRSHGKPLPGGAVMDAQ